MADKIIIELEPITKEELARDIKACLKEVGVSNKDVSELDKGGFFDLVRKITGYLEAYHKIKATHREVWLFLEDIKLGEEKIKLEEVGSPV